MNRRETMKTLTNRALIAAAILAAAAFIVGYGRQQQDSGGKYAEVNGLKMYYEIHGSGRPLVLLHGAFGFAEGWGAFLPTLTKTHQVIAIELQGHGHTNDIDRPLTFEQMADDAAALLKQLKIKDADFFGYSMGGTVALGVAIRHPELVRKLAFYGSCAGTAKDTYDPEAYKQFQSLGADFARPEAMAHSGNEDQGAGENLQRVFGGGPQCDQSADAHHDGRPRRGSSRARR